MSRGAVVHHQNPLCADPAQHSGIVPAHRKGIRAGVVKGADTQPCRFALAGALQGKFLRRFVIAEEPERPVRGKGSAGTAKRAQVGKILRREGQNRAPGQGRHRSKQGIIPAVIQLNQIIAIGKDFLLPGMVIGKLFGHFRLCVVQHRRSKVRQGGSFRRLCGGGNRFCFLAAVRPPAVQKKPNTPGTSQNKCGQQSQQANSVMERRRFHVGRPLFALAFKMHSANPFPKSLFLMRIHAAPPTKPCKKRQPGRCPQAKALHNGLAQSGGVSGTMPCRERPFQPRGVMGAVKQAACRNQPCRQNDFDLPQPTCQQSDRQ